MNESFLQSHHNEIIVIFSIHESTYSFIAADMMKQLGILGAHELVAPYWQTITRQHSVQVKII